MRRTPLWCAFAALLMLALSGCGDEPSPEADTNRSAKPTASHTESAKPSADPMLEFVNSSLTSMDDRAQKYLASHGIGPSVDKILTKKVRKRKNPYEFRQILKASYLGTEDNQGGSGLGLLSGNQLSPAGEAVLNALAEADKHALDPERYKISWIEKKIEEARKVSLAAPPSLPWDQVDAKALAAHLKGSGFDAKAPDAHNELLKIILKEGSPAPEIKTKVDAWKTSQSSQGSDLAKLELALADGLLRYAWDMRYHNRHWYPEEDFPRRSDRNAILREKLQRAVLDLTPETLPEFVENLPPHFDQYDKLIKGLEKYRAIENNGGWDKVPKRKLRKGSRGKLVQKLKKRLKAEGFFKGDVEGEVFGKALQNAVKEYQEVHQLKVTGAAERSFWKSLNISVADRIKQIEVTLQRWRESRIGADDYYIHVNIPDFHAEAWNQNKREYRFRVIVGNTTFGCDRKKKVRTRINATPLFSDKIEAVILNPYWNVPERIWKEEILPELLEDENYLVDNNYECLEGEGVYCTRVRQGSGDGNALGKVKFIFPNKHSVYMHDTNKKTLFSLPIRAFSHGCMRVHEPMKFAEYLLKTDSQWNERDFNKRLGRGKESGIRLKHHVPIHIEYYTVRIDDEGRVNFLADVYRYDKHRMAGTKMSEIKCEPPPDPELPDPNAEPEEEEEEENTEGTENNEGAENNEGTGEETPTPEGNDAPKDKETPKKEEKPSSNDDPPPKTGKKLIPINLGNKPKPKLRRIKILPPKKVAGDKAP